MYATCRNDECGNDNIAIDVGPLTTTDEVTGEVRTIDTVICGACNQQITEITDAPPPDSVTTPIDEP